MKEAYEAIRSGAYRPVGDPFGLNPENLRRSRQLHQDRKAVR